MADAVSYNFVDSQRTTKYYHPHSLLESPHKLLDHGRIKVRLDICKHDFAKRLLVFMPRPKACSYPAPRGNLSPSICWRPRSRGCSEFYSGLGR